MDKLHFDRTDYSVVVKNRAPPPSSWKWEIYRAGRSSPIKQSSVYFHTTRPGSPARGRAGHPDAGQCGRTAGPEDSRGRARYDFAGTWGEALNDTLVKHGKR